MPRHAPRRPAHVNAHIRRTTTGLQREVKVFTSERAIAGRKGGFAQNCARLIAPFDAA